MPGNLSDYDFKIYYGPEDDRLRDFYIQALSRSIQYDRTAGFFSSSALAIAAAGVVRLIGNGGTMRLLVGAKLTQADVEAVERGEALRDKVEANLLAAFPDPVDAFQHQRLEVLAWMVANGRLAIKVVVARDAAGRPIPADQAFDYYHSKSGIFTDSLSNRVGFSGSINESETGWIRNYEEFTVYRSWDGTHAYVALVARSFDRLWLGKEPNWLALDFPQAVAQELISYQPEIIPEYDPLERQPPKVGKEIPKGAGYVAVPQRERILFQFLRDAPALLGANRLGVVTSAVTPWPHQAHVAQQVADRFPERFLLADEVGLGKTIEAGLALRQLLISGRVRRALLLTPKSVSRQWQEELYEKCALNVPLYDGFRFRDYFDEELEGDTANPWDAHPVVIASSQLVKRRDRVQLLLSAQPWDLVMVDEAHHARRKDFLQNYYRPNRLLELLLQLKDRTAGLILLTATPMQVAPVEVWDLLRLLGLGGRWAAAEENFLQFFEELGRPVDEADWDFVFQMARDSLAGGQTLDPEFARFAEKRIGLVEWEQVRALPHTGNPAQVMRHLSETGLALAIEMARRLTPLQRFMFRNTRSLLREYRKRGLIQDRVPERDPRPEWITLKDEEDELYQRIEDYITNFYQRYERERKGLGFVMTVYRRRLTSSFYAVKRSLERRLKFLKGQPEPNTVAGLEDEDIEQDDLQLDIGEETEEAGRSRFKDEVDYVEKFIADIGRLGTDSKFERLAQRLNELFRSRDKVIVFTQYTDTLDYLRDQLRETYGAAVACYSGRGGEYWTGIGWQHASKEQVKQDFREGDKLKILLCTESASEGLNLQTCGVLINYDMPWNPMRVEQRIGRIDRIGQVYDQVWIRNYFIEHTVEAIIYQRLSDRINWFEAVVGDLQPILSKVARSIQTLAMLPAAERRRRLDQEIDDIRQALDEQKTQALKIDAFLKPEEPTAETSGAPVTLIDLERLLVGSPALAGQFVPHPTIPRAYFLKHEAEDVTVTFSPPVFDEFPETVRLLTYGDPLLADLLSTVPSPSVSPETGLLRLGALAPTSTVAFTVPDQEDWVATVQALEAASSSKDAHSWPPGAEQTAIERFQANLANAQQHQANIQDRQRQAELTTLNEKGRRLLIQAALVEIALGQQPAMLGEAYPYEFSETAVAGLRRHRYPFGPLLKLVNAADLRPSPTDDFYLKIQNLSAEQLRLRFGELRDQAGELVTQIQAHRAKEGTAQPPQAVAVEAVLYEWQ